MNTETIDALVGIAFFALFIGIFYGPWQSVVTEYARQRLFEVRDRIFDLAHENPDTFGFSSDEYRILRNSINGSIRFCHFLTHQWMVFALFMLRDKRPKQLTTEIIERIDNENIREEVNSLFFEVGIAIMLQMVFRSLPLFILMWLMAPLLVVISAIERKKIAVRIIRPIENEVIRSGYMEYMERTALKAA